VKSNKPDMADAEAVREAVTRPTMRFVPIKELAQQDRQALHRVRERLESPDSPHQRDARVTQ
jgi:transposase